MSRFTLSREPCYDFYRFSHINIGLRIRLRRASLVMRQGSAATEYLYYENWRLALGVTENIPGEVGTGGGQCATG
jgi:hypothetical protein